MQGFPLLLLVVSRVAPGEYHAEVSLRAAFEVVCEKLLEQQ